MRWLEFTRGPGQDLLSSAGITPPVGVSELSLAVAFVRNWKKENFTRHCVCEVTLLSSSTESYKTWRATLTSCQSPNIPQTCRHTASKNVELSQGCDQVEFSFRTVLSLGSDGLEKPFPCSMLVLQRLYLIWPDLLNE
jgi:hypothetical protein